LKVLQLNANKSNLTMHMLLTQEAETTDIILFQEPWSGQIGGTIRDNNANLESVQGTVQHPSWIPFLPLQHRGSRWPRAIIYISKSVLTQYACSTRPDIIASEDVQCIEFQNRLNVDTFLVVNVYNDPLLAHNGALTKILDFYPNPQVPVILAGDFNLHHLMWSEERMATSPRAEDFFDWVNDNGFVIFNQPHEFTFFHQNTAFSPTIIDLTFANAQSLVREWNIPIDKDVGSDHCTLTWNIDKSLQEDYELESYAIKERKREKWVNTFKGKLAVLFPNSPLLTIANIDHAAKSLQEAISEATNTHNTQKCYMVEPRD
jgi:endonuclease/exonuclease/phosphatase family metal-dependent hydrolase